MQSLHKNTSHCGSGKVCGWKGQAWNGARDPVGWPLSLSKHPAEPGCQGVFQAQREEVRMDPACGWMSTPSSGRDRQQRNTTRNAFKIVKGYESSQMGDWLERRGRSEELPLSRILDDSKEPPRAGHVGMFTKCQERPVQRS